MPKNDHVTDDFALNLPVDIPVKKWYLSSDIKFHLCIRKKWFSVEKSYSIDIKRPSDRRFSSEYSCRYLCKKLFLPQMSNSTYVFRKSYFKLKKSYQIQKINDLTDYSTLNLPVDIPVKKWYLTSDIINHLYIQKKWFLIKESY